jgi:hypothetical protein
MKVLDLRHPIARLGALLIAVGIIGLIVSSIFISNVERDLEINALGDVLTTSCDQYDTLNDFFGTNVKPENCEISSEEKARQTNSERLPLARNLRVLSGIFVPLGFLGLFTPRILNLKTPSSREDTSASAQKDTSDIEVRLQSLESLKKSNLISDSEYEEKRQRLLDNL